MLLMGALDGGEYGIHMEIPSWLEVSRWSIWIFLHMHDMNVHALGWFKSYYGNKCLESYTCMLSSSML